MKRTVNFTCEQSVYDAVAAIAKRERRSVSAQVEYILMQHIGHDRAAREGSQIDMPKLEEVLYEA